MGDFERPEADDSFDIQFNRIAAATADASDPGIHRTVREVLQLLREHMEMEVAFVSEIAEGYRTFRYVESKPGADLIHVGGADPVASSFCQRVLEGRIPQAVTDIAKLADFSDLPKTPWPIGAHLSTPIVLESGRVYGTLCCFSRQPDESIGERDLKRLQMGARMIARLLDQQQRRHFGQAPPGPAADDDGPAKTSG